MRDDEATLYLVQEVHNFGGFFGGDTVTLNAIRRGGSEAEEQQTEGQRSCELRVTSGDKDAARRSDLATRRGSRTHHALVTPPSRGHHTGLTIV